MGFLPVADMMERHEPTSCAWLGHEKLLTMRVVMSGFSRRMLVFVCGFLMSFYLMIIFYALHLHVIPCQLRCDLYRWFTCCDFTTHPGCPGRIRNGEIGGSSSMRPFLMWLCSPQMAAGRLVFSIRLSSYISNSYGSTDLPVWFDMKQPDLVNTKSKSSMGSGWVGQAHGDAPSSYSTDKTGDSTWQLMEIDWCFNTKFWISPWIGQASTPRAGLWPLSILFTFW